MDWEGDVVSAADLLVLAETVGAIETDTEIDDDIEGV
jgi:hypothetical protein